jgi:diguanylate cyclase
MGRTEKIIGFLQVNSHRRVLFMTALCTAFTVAAAVCVVAIVLSSIPLLPREALLAVLAIAALIPMIITPPLAFILLHILRLLTNTIGHVDKQVRFDPMTGLYSRSYFLEKARTMLDEGGAFLMVDADHFKRVNDTHGHAVGDETLKRFAQALRAGNRSTSLIGRLGGEEFGIFIPKGRMADADLAAIRTSAAICSLCHTISGREIHMTASIGGAVHEAGMALEDLIRLADERLYRAKNTGRNRAILSETPPIVPDFSDIEFWDEPATSAAA